MSDPPAQITPTPRSTLRRKKERGSFERPVIDAILDEGLICHLGFRDAGSTFVVPMAYARVDDVLYLHGAAANHALTSLCADPAACVTVTLIDALVFSRSAFHHSMNYRSVLLFGQAVLVRDDQEKHDALLAVVDHMAHGRGTDVRPPSPSELRATQVVRFPIQEGSAKIRTGGPVEEPEDLELAIWAGELPVALETGLPVPDDGLPNGLAVPSYLSAYRRPRGAQNSRPSTSQPNRGEGG
jgi:uncharacterized protein